MKSFFLVTLALLAAAASISAFAPNYSRKNLITSSHIKLFMARSKPAKSQEEDVELTRAIIMKHIGSVEDFVVDDDVDEAEASVESNDSKSTKVSTMDKLKNKGRKIKNKLKSKIQKN